MKRFVFLFLTAIVSISVFACGENIENNSVDSDSSFYSSINAEDSKNVSGENTDFSKNVSANNESEYGELQKIVDSYGFPIHLRMNDGYKLYEIIIYKDHAEFERLSSFDDPINYNNLSWTITENRLEISGEWEEKFTVNIEKGRAIPDSGSNEYRIVTYDENGEVEFHVD